MPETSNTTSTTVKSSPLRLLILTPIPSPQLAYQPFPQFLQTLTGAATSTDLTTFAGYTSHPPLHLKTKYYESNVAIWCDELPTTTSSKPVGESEPDSTLPEWQTQMLSSEAREVRDVIGGIVLLLPFNSVSTLTATMSTAAPHPQISDWIPYVEAVTSLRDAIEDESGRDVASLVVLQDVSTDTSVSAGVVANSDKSGAALLEQLEEAALSTHGLFGWDFVLWSAPTSVSSLPTLGKQSLENDNEPTPRNTFGEKVGFPRIFEVLEGIDWTAGPSDSNLDLDIDDTHEGGGSFDFLDDLNPSHAANLKLASHTGAVPPRSSIRNASERDLLDGAEREFTNEMTEVKMDLLSHRDEGTFGDGDETEEAFQVEQLSGLMERVVAIKEAADEMSGPEKERFAKREVERIMRELG